MSYFKYNFRSATILRSNTPYYTHTNPHIDSVMYDNLIKFDYLKRLNNSLRLFFPRKTIVL